MFRLISAYPGCNGSADIINALSAHGGRSCCPCVWRARNICTRSTKLLTRVKNRYRHDSTSSIAYMYRTYSSRYSAIAGGPVPYWVLCGLTGYPVPACARPPRAAWFRPSSGRVQAPVKPCSTVRRPSQPGFISRPSGSTPADNSNCLMAPDGEGPLDTPLAAVGASSVSQSSRCFLWCAQ